MMISKNAISFIPKQEIETSPKHTFKFEINTALPKQKVKSVIFDVYLGTTLYKLDFNKLETVKYAISAAEKFLSIPLDSAYKNLVDKNSKLKPLYRYTRGSIRRSDYIIQGLYVSNGILFIYANDNLYY